MAKITVKAFVRARFAEQAAKALLGTNAVKGEHYKILELDDGRFGYQVLKEPPKTRGKAKAPRPISKPQPVPKPNLKY